MSTSPRQVLRPVREGMEIDADALLQYMRREGIVPGHVKEIHLQQFGHGQSNPTYLVQAGTVEMVLRKQPPGKLLASAHAVHREFEVMRALRSAEVAVPAMLALCKDPNVVGTTFFLMSVVDGKLMLDPNMPAFGASQRRAAYCSMGETLARLHSVDPAAVSLSSFGKPQAFCVRQVQRWLQQYIASTAPTDSNSSQTVVNPRLPEMLQLAKWLQEHAPAADACAGPPCIVHGDFRLDNLVLGGGMEVKAVLDWELATLGNPLSDLSYNCLTYHLPKGVPALPRFTTPLPAGIPTEAEYIATYCAGRGISPPPPTDWAFFMSLSIFRAASILAGVYARALAGNASSASARTAGAPSTVKAMAAAALKLIAAAPGVPFQHASPLGSVPQVLAPPAPHSAMSAACAMLHVSLRAFVDQRIYPASKAFSTHAQSDVRWQPFPAMESLKSAARAEGLWNLWISKDLSTCFQKLLENSAELAPVERKLLAGPGLSNLDYAHLAKVMGEVPWCSEVFNCSAPDTGNMEVISRYGSPAQQHKWLLPLLRGDIRSCFAMTEPAVASSDATNIQGSIRRVGSDYVINGHKIWISGACDSRCKVVIFMGKTDPSAPPHQQQSMILVPLSAPGVHIKRPMTVFGADDAPHGHAEMLFTNVRVAADSIVLGEGRGFEIAQGRLGPGRLHHCMRVCGMGDFALRLVAARVLERQTFGVTLAESPLVQAQLAEAWLKLHCAWLSVLHAAGRLDQVGNKAARQDITAAKVVVPLAVLSVIDTAIQLHGAAGVGQDTELAGLWGAVRTLRLADGPDEVHLMALGKQVVKKYGKYEASHSKL